MKHYEYPKVPLSSQPYRPPDPPNLTIPTTEVSRFSWTTTPGEAEGRMWQRRESYIPALPQIPDHLQPAVEAQNHTYAPPQPQPVQEQLDFQQDNKADSATLGRHATQTVRIMPTHPEQYQQYSQGRQPAQPPDPVPTRSPNNYIPLQPDTNPLLSPTTPTKIAQHSKTTNMAVLEPSTGPSHFLVNQYNLRPPPPRGGTWQHGLCSCAEPSICLTGLFCPCIVYGKTQYRLALRSEKKDPTNMLGYTSVNGSCVAFGVLCGISGILAGIQRARVRKAYEMEGVAGNVSGDLVKGLCCCCCVVAQDEKEMKFREEDGRRANGLGKEGGYVPPGQMTFAAPPR